MTVDTPPLDSADHAGTESLQTRRWRRQSRANPSLKRGFSREPPKTRFRWLLDVANSERRRFAPNSPETEPPSLADGLTIAFYSRLYARVRARPATEKPATAGRAANSSRKRNSRRRAKIRFRYPVRFG
jgi:hypothetical protein